MTIADAIKSLQPKAEFSIMGENYDEVIWINSEITKPDIKDVLDELKRLNDIEKANEYKRLRAAEYPPVADYLDAIVRGDAGAISDYIDKCKAVKLKYPKKS